MLKFVSENNSETIDIIFKDGDVWANIEMIAKLYSIDRSELLDI